MSTLYKFCFYVPESHLESVKSAVFQAGAGAIGDYDCCAWQTLGEGQFRPNDNAQPFLGNKNVIEAVPEYKVELVCDKSVLPQAILALKASHPYEEPAFQYWPVNPAL